MQTENSSYRYSGISLPPSTLDIPNKDALLSEACQSNLE